MEEGTAAEERGFFRSLFGESTAAPASAGAQSLLWWDQISSAASYGGAALKRDEMGVTRPPGVPATSQYLASRPSASVNDSSSRSPR